MRSLFLTKKRRTRNAKTTKKFYITKGRINNGYFGVGAYYDEDVSQDFIQANLVGVGWDVTEAPELHQFMREKC